MKVKAIITGASGMVGEGVLHECCQRNEVEKYWLLEEEVVVTIIPNSRRS